MDNKELETIEAVREKMMCCGETLVAAYQARIDNNISKGVLELFVYSYPDDITSIPELKILDKAQDKYLLTPEERNDIANAVDQSSYRTSVDYWDAIIDRLLEAQLDKVFPNPKSVILKEIVAEHLYLEDTGYISSYPGTKGSVTKKSKK